MLMLILQIISSTLLVLNKWHVYKERPKGWLYGIVGTIAITIYFYLQMISEPEYNLWIMIVYDFALITLLAYAYVFSSAKENLERKAFLDKWNMVFKIPTVLITGAVCTFLYIQMKNAQLMAPQFIMSWCGLVGTVCLIFKHKWIRIFGWVLYFTAHIICTYLTIKTHSVFLAAGQIFSAYIASLGIRDELKPKQKV